MDAGSDQGSAAKGSAIDLEVAGFGLVSYRFSFPPLSYCTMCSSLACLLLFLLAPLKELSLAARIGSCTQMGNGM